MRGGRALVAPRDARTASCALGLATTRSPLKAKYSGTTPQRLARSAILDGSIVAAVGRLYHVPSEACTSATAQTAGMSRMAALSGDTVGSRAIWMGETHVAPGVASGPHHHGESETGIYVASGSPAFIYSEDGREIRV